MRRTGRSSIERLPHELGAPTLRRREPDAVQRFQPHVAMIRTVQQRGQTPLLRDAQTADTLDVVMTRTSLVLTVLVWTACGALVGGVFGLIALVCAFVHVGRYIGLPLGHRYPELEYEGRFGAEWEQIERDRRFASRHLDRFLRY
jgi:hypothetical protein